MEPDKGEDWWVVIAESWVFRQAVYGYFRKWHLVGTWERIHTALRERTRLKAERGANPTAAILDSSSVRTREQVGSGVTTATRS